jgi:ubiquinone/menaquinone biosynthesis C-methylase UbiE
MSYSTEWSGVQKFILCVLVLLCINYLFHLAVDKAQGYTTNFTEGFEGAVGTVTQIPHTDNSLYTWITDPQLIYDEFYAGVYDQLCAQSQRTQAKVSLLTSIWKKAQPNTKEWTILDAGCGTGHAVASFAKQDVGLITGLDYAPSMLRQAEKVVIPAAKLSQSQQSSIRWKQDSLINPSAAAAGEFTHAVCMYFSFYYIKDQEEFFRHMNLWVKQGGKLAVEVVNKYKFDPVLESASPFLAFSVQKYSKERIRKSKVVFDKFDYEAEFMLSDPKAEFYETFRFKNGHVRRQKHEFLMPNIDAIVAMGKRAGWKYVGYQDLNPLGFEYGYILLFEK